MINEVTLSIGGTVCSKTIKRRVYSEVVNLEVRLHRGCLLFDVCAKELIGAVFFLQNHHSITVVIKIGFILVYVRCLSPLILKIFRHHTYMNYSDLMCEGLPIYHLQIHNIPFTIHNKTVL